MLIVMKPHATEEDVRGVCRKIEAMGFRPHPMPGAQRTAIGLTGNPKKFRILGFIFEKNVETII